MNNEYTNDNNNKSPEENTGDNQYRNVEQPNYTNLNQSNQQTPDNNLYGNNYSYNKSNSDYGYQNIYDPSKGYQNIYDPNKGYQNNFDPNKGYQNNFDPNKGYPTPELKEEIKKPKKKRGFYKIITLGAAAIAFGIIAGAVFQGFNALTGPKDQKNDESFEIGQTDDNEQPVITEPADQSILEGEVDSSVIVPTNSAGDGIITDVSDVVEKVMPSIVAINSSGTVTRNDFFGRQYNEPMAGSGSGIIIGQNGSEILIVTNNHVISGAETVEIVFTDETTAEATVKGADANADLAVLSVSMNELSEETASTIKVAALGNSDDVKAGEMAIAIGNALGYGQSVTVGYISAVNREVAIDNNEMTLLQTDAAINPGNSGGALINASGEVIGINSVKYASEEVEGMGYAIPISSAVPMMNELMNRDVIDETEQGFLGIYLDSAQNVTEMYAERFNMPVGIYVNEVVEDSPADIAGLKQGNIITKFNESDIKTIDDLINNLSYHKAGEEITLTISVLDNGEYVDKTITVTLGEKQ
jgi:serine protease Do